MLVLEFLGAKEQLTALIESHRMLKNLVNCVDTCVKMLESFFVGTNNFLTELGAKAQILETTTVQKFKEVNTQLDTLQGTMEKVLGLIECIVSEPRLTTLDSGPLSPPTKKTCTFSLGSLGITKLKTK